MNIFANGLEIDSINDRYNLNDLFRAGNLWRLSKGLKPRQLHAFLLNEATQRQLDAMAEVLGVTKESLVVADVSRGRYSCRYVHPCVMVMAVEFLSPEAYARLIKSLLDKFNGEK